MFCVPQICDSDYGKHQSAPSGQQKLKAEAEPDPFLESGLRLSPTAAEAKQKVRSKKANKRAPPMAWSKKQELFSNFWRAWTTKPLVEADGEPKTRNVLLWNRKRNVNMTLLERCYTLISIVFFLSERLPAFLKWLSGKMGKKLERTTKLYFKGKLAKCTS